MSQKRRALGRGLGALIPSAPPSDDARPTDIFFKDKSEAVAAQREGGQGAVATAVQTDVSRETDGSSVDVSRETSSTGTEVPRETTDAGTGSGTTGSGTTDSNTADGQTGSGAADPTLAPVPGARFAEIPVSRIRPNPRQPRQVFDDDELAELVHSITEIGVLQPIVVREITAADGVDDHLDDHLNGHVHDHADGSTGGSSDGSTNGAAGARFELIMGERRWRASQRAGHETIPAIVKDTHDDDLLRDALLENLHRSQLNALEEAAAYQQLLDDFGCTHDELATRIGRSRPQISNTLRLLKLPPLVARRVAAGVLSAGHARALLALDDGGAMERLAQRIVAEGLSVRSVEEIVSMGGADEPRRRAPRAGNRHPQLDDLAAALSDRFDTRVNISLGKRKGKLTVEFASVDDLNRIVDLLSPDDGPVSTSDAG